MLSIFPITDQSPAPQDSPSELEAAPLDEALESIAPPPMDSGEIVMGRRQIASLGFVAVLIIGIMSAVAYFAGRKTTEPQVIERVVERVVQSKPAATPEVKQGPPPNVVVKTVEKKPQQTLPLQSPTLRAAMIAPILNQVYLQVGSVDIGIAEVMVEGLRQKGIPAIVGIGISNKVARVLVGPFATDAEQRLAQQHVEALGFRPFARTFSEHDLQPAPGLSAPPSIPAKP